MIFDIHRYLLGLHSLYSLFSFIAILISPGRLQSLFYPKQGNKIQAAYWTIAFFDRLTLTVFRVAYIFWFWKEPDEK